MNLDDLTPSRTVARLEGTLDLCFNALTRGIAVAESLHAENRWDVRADPHMFSHIVRREALEIIKGQNPDAREQDNLGAAMSGLHLTVGETDELRVWHGYEGEVRVPSSEAGRDFLTQPSSTAQFLPGFEPPVFPAMARSILLWEHKDGELSRFELLRPLDAEAGRVTIDWREPLLLRFAQRMDDVVYRRRAAEGHDEGEAQTS